ncbi:carbohydrate ABC transporter permease [Actinomadura sp. HBU206391]|uniref:carbohydrate ABC transporter permease n=1 Tax=Actinomadura sp. HBU206391 TaxID=2731692 RepID=UPI00164F2941|nr:sugar ABC transporter permease [Actinomadura sp. HBU206391]MBC6463544.1 sugar ABC transporter permease [Actinomadura sp. HBU206391]
MAAPTTTVSSRPAARLARARRAPVLGWAVPMAPAFGLLALFFAGPILWCFWAAFTDIALTGASASAPNLVGLRNFREMFSDPDFFSAALLTVVFVAGSAIFGQNILGLALALLMRGRRRVVRALVGGVVVSAWVMPEIVVGFIWYAFLADDGTLNSVLTAVGLSAGQWLYELPLVSVIVANIWRGTAFSMLVYSAALSEVPDELHEAAAVDGASAFQRLRHITLPLIRRAAMTNLMTITLQTLSVFTLIFVMTGGGPGNKSQTLPLYMYQEAFKFSQMGYGTAVAIVMLAIGAVFSVIYIRLLRREV